jgi:hypothetical protein
MKSKLYLTLTAVFMLLLLGRPRALLADGLPASGTYVIRSAVSQNKVLDIAGASQKSGGNLQIYEGNGSAAQQFTLTRLADGTYEVSPVCSALALDVEGARSANGTNVRQYTPNGTRAQRWNISDAGDGTVSFSPACAPGTCLDIAGASMRNGTNVRLYASNGTAAQRFLLEAVDSERVAPEGTFAFTSALDHSKAIDVAGGSVRNCANVQLYALNGTAAQQFSLTYLGGGWYRIMNVKAVKALDIAGGSGKKGANIQLYSSNGTDAQRWRFLDGGDGTFTIVSALGNAVDVAGANTRNCANIQTYTPNGTAAQRFSFSPVVPVNPVLSADTVLSYAAGTVLEESQIDWNNVSSYFRISGISAGDAVYNRIIGKSYRDNPDIGLSDLRYLKMLHFNYNGKVQVGEMITNRAIAAEALDVFYNLFKSRYQINSMYLVDRYWTGDGVTTDLASVRADNTSCFNYRKASDADNLSRHAFGMAIDLNPFENPYVYVYPDGRHVSDPAEAQDYAVNRSAGRPHVITGSDLAVQLFKSHGFSWGGDWGGPYDYQHFVK